MQKVKLSDALTVSKIRTHLGVIEGIGWSGNQPYVSINGVDHRVFDDSLDWDRGEWSIVLPPGARYLAQVFVNGQTVCYEDIVHCIEERKVQAHEIASDKRSQRKESLMKEVKLSDALEVTRITCSLDLNGQIKDDTLYWSVDGWYVRTINGMEVKAYPKFNKEYVDYQEMVKLIYASTKNSKTEPQMNTNQNVTWITTVSDIYMNFTKTKGFVIPAEIPTGAGALSQSPCAVIYPIIDRVIVQSLLGDMRLILDKMMHFNAVVNQSGGAFRCGSDNVKCTIINHGDPMHNSLKIEFVTCQSLSITVPFTYTHGSL